MDKVSKRGADDIIKVGKHLEMISEMFPNAMITVSSIGADNPNPFGATMVSAMGETMDEQLPYVLTMISSSIDNVARQFKLDKRGILKTIDTVFEQWDKKQAEEKEAENNGGEN